MKAIFNCKINGKIVIIKKKYSILFGNAVPQLNNVWLCSWDSLTYSIVVLVSIYYESTIKNFSILVLIDFKIIFGFLLFMMLLGLPMTFTRVSFTVYENSF